MAICFEVHTNSSHFNAAPQGCWLFASFAPFSSISIEFQTHPTTGPLWSFEDLPLLSPTWAPKWQNFTRKNGWCCLSSPALPQWLRKCHPHQIWQLAWEKWNICSSEKEHEKVVTRSEWQPKSKVLTLGKQKSLHCSDFKHHIHTSHQAFILGQALSIRLSRVQPRCIERWACRFIAKRAGLWGTCEEKKWCLEKTEHWIL